MLITIILYFGIRFHRSYSKSYGKMNCRLYFSGLLAFVFIVVASAPKLKHNMVVRDVVFKFGFCIVLGSSMLFREGVEHRCFRLGPSGNSSLPAYR